MIESAMAARLQPSQYAVLDLDGTLHPGSLGLIVAEEIALRFPDRSALHRILGSHIKNIRTGHSLSDFTYAYELYGSLIEGLNVADLALIHKKVWKRERLRLFDYVRPAVMSLKHSGYQLVLLSGSPHGIVSLAAKDLGIDYCQGAEYFVDGQLSTATISVQVGTPGTKSVYFVDVFGSIPSLAVGNTSGDSDILGLSERAIAFEPDDKLRSSAVERGWSIADRESALSAIKHCSAMGSP
ncbi:HAD family hydrolase [Streptomyces sp. NPDC002952]|uniref:HAD family hydrolase n=1 Tax=Streptomyces sp. NPDC002952 TaxID=3364673 RepID=UPI0036A12F82